MSARPGDSQEEKDLQFIDKGLASLLRESGVYGKRRTIPFFFVLVLDIRLRLSKVSGKPSVS